MKQFIIPLIMATIICSVAFAQTPQLHFWKSDYEQKFDWCKINMPSMNISHIDKNVAFCYGEGWNDYCQISFPEYCPENNYTDHDRCIRNCATYGTFGTGACPC